MPVAAGDAFDRPGSNPKPGQSEPGAVPGVVDGCHPGRASARQKMVKRWRMESIARADCTNRSKTRARCRAATRCWLEFSGCYRTHIRALGAKLVRQPQELLLRREERVYDVGIEMGAATCGQGCDRLFVRQARPVRA